MQEPRISPVVALSSANYLRCDASSSSSLTIDSKNDLRRAVLIDRQDVRFNSCKSGQDRKINRIPSATLISPSSDVRGMTYWRFESRRDGAI